MKQRSLFGTVTKTKTKQVKPRGKVNTPIIKSKHDYPPDNCKAPGIYYRIRQLRLQMLVHSCIYYDMGESLISDAEFDKRARELVKLQSENPDIAKQVKWADAFESWDATTGYDLPKRDPWVVAKAQYIYSLSKQRE